MKQSTAVSMSLLLALSAVLLASGEEKLRRVEENTPTPCLKAYSEDLVQAAVSKHLENRAGTSEKPHLLLMLGGSGAGKGTFLNHIGKHSFNVSEFVLHGLDEYLEYLPEYVKTVSDPDVVYKDAADACYGGGAIPIAKAAEPKITSGRLNTIYEETGKNLDRILKRVLPPFEKFGYRITTVLIGNHAEIAISRAGKRFQASGRYAPDDYIRGTFKDNLENYKELAKSGRVHEAVYCDNSCVTEGGSLDEAMKSRDCIKCWRDDVDAEDGGISLIPVSSLLSGPPQYMQPLRKEEL
jgi:hypothetical protein